MRKIRNFKLVLRTKELQRRAKRARLDLAACGLGSEDIVSTFLEDFATGLSPAVVYESFGASQSPQESPIPGVASSLGIATLGAGAERELASLAGEEGGLRVPAAQLAADMALDQAVQFVLTLLEEEAAQEGCQLSPLSGLEDPAALASAVERLQAAKIGVTLAEGRLSPPHSAAFSVSWLTKSKSKSKKG